MSLSPETQAREQRGASAFFAERQSLAPFTSADGSIKDAIVPGVAALIQDALVMTEPFSHCFVPGIPS
jgi:hypothetical protein